MGVGNGAVFKMVPKYVPHAVGGASGLVGGFGALGGFVIPPTLGLFAGALGDAGYSGGFFVYVVLAVAAIMVSIGFIRTRNNLVPADTDMGWSRQDQQGSKMSHFLDRLTFFRKHRRDVLRWPRHHDGTSRATGRTVIANAGSTTKLCAPRTA